MKCLVLQLSQIAIHAPPGGRMKVIVFLAAVLAPLAAMPAAHTFVLSGKMPGPHENHRADQVIGVAQFL
jgi:hypothetical protein